MACEIVAIFQRRHVNACGVRKLRWRGALARLLNGKAQRVKIFWVGNYEGTVGLGILPAEKCVDKSSDVVTICDIIINLRMLWQGSVVTFILGCAPYAGLEHDQKYYFYHMLMQTTIKTDANGYLIITGDFNGHIGE